MAEYALFTALAFIFSYIESLFPLPLPFPLCRRIWHFPDSQCPERPYIRKSFRPFLQSGWKYFEPACHGGAAAHKTTKTFRHYGQRRRRHPAQHRTVSHRLGYCRPGGRTPLSAVFILCRFGHRNFDWYFQPHAVKTEHYVRSTEIMKNNLFGLFHELYIKSAI